MLLIRSSTFFFFLFFFYKNDYEYSNFSKYLSNDVDEVIISKDLINYLLFQNFCVSFEISKLYIILRFNPFEFYFMLRNNQNIITIFKEITFIYLDHVIKSSHLCCEWTLISFKLFYFHRLFLLLKPF